MQYSFIAIIEAWLSGVLFMITTALLLFRIYWGISDVKISWDIIINFSPIITILLCSLAYSIGWIVNHIAESIFDPLLQHRFRAELEKENKVNFFKVRAYVFQYGLDQTLNDIKYDRQVIRIARANCFNFFIMALVMLSYLVINQSSRIIPLFFFFFCFFASCGAFFQWKSRYEATYRKFYQVYFALSESLSDQSNK